MSSSGGCGHQSGLMSIYALDDGAGKKTKSGARAEAGTASQGTGEATG
jgi:hypothetical protein|eukprot:COSAG01_NODE_9771_length_2349_cov_0.980000_3_plen_48_part_00